MSKTADIVLQLKEELGDVDLNAGDGNCEASRARTLALARQLCHRLETPWERIVRLHWTEVLYSSGCPS